MQRIPGRMHLVPGKRIPRHAPLGNHRAVELLDRDAIGGEHRALIGRAIGVTDDRSSCSHTVMRRGFASCKTPFKAKKPPPLTMVASTLLYVRQRSRPPCASRTFVSNSFMAFVSNPQLSKRSCMG